MKRSADHVAIGDNSLRCLNCGEEYAFATPVPITLLLAMGKAWETDHRRCKPSTQGTSRMQYTTALEWRRSWDTGASSIAIFDFFTHGMRPVKYPHDPADFGRCYRLLKVAPEWRARITELGKYDSKWKLLSERWDELEKLYEEELPSGVAPKLYAAIKECVG